MSPTSYHCSTPRGHPTHRATIGQTFSEQASWMAFFKDPDGNILALMSEVPKE